MRNRRSCGDVRVHAPSGQGPVLLEFATGADLPEARCTAGYGSFDGRCRRGERMGRLADRQIAVGEAEAVAGIASSSERRSQISWSLVSIAHPRQCPSAIQTASGTFSACRTRTTAAQADGM